MPAPGRTSSANWMCCTPRRRATPAPTAPGHAAIVRALAAGEGNLAARRVSARWRQSLARLQPVIGVIGEQGTW